jgi:hypothetical protein
MGAGSCGFPDAPVTGYQSCDFLTLSQQPQISQTPGYIPLKPLSPIPTVINMFFVTKLNPPSTQSGGQLYGFSWEGNNGIAIASNTFFPPSRLLPPRPDTLPHELGHVLGLEHIGLGAGPSPTGQCDASYPACMANLMTAGGTPSGNLRTEPAVSGSPAKVPLAPLLGGKADQLSQNGETQPPAPPITQLGQVLTSGFVSAIPYSQMTASKTGGEGAAAAAFAGARLASSSFSYNSSTSVFFDISSPHTASGRTKTLWP